MLEPIRGCGTWIDPEVVAAIAPLPPRPLPDESGSEVPGSMILLDRHSLEVRGDHAEIVRRVIRARYLLERYRSLADRSEMESAWSELAHVLDEAGKLGLEVFGFQRGEESEP